MKIKTSELTGAALDWAVAKCEGVTYLDDGPNKGLFHWPAGGPGELHRWSTKPLSYSHDWYQGGPIIEREGIGLEAPNCERQWLAQVGMNYEQEGPTPLIAAMRCFAASKLGDEVEVPEELV